MDFDTRVLGAPFGRRDIRKPKPLEPWNLAALKEVPARVLVHDANDEVGRFMLTLAAAYNDLKDLVLFEQYVLAFDRPKPIEVSPGAGQWRGLMTRIHRSIAGIVNELLIMMREQSAVQKNAEMQRLVSRLHGRYRPSWDALLDAAHGRRGGKRINELLNRIRNTSASHYDVAELVEGFEAHFIRDAASSPAETNRAAFYSFGPNLQGTRFHYADAAQQKILKKWGLVHGTTEADKELVELVKAVNEALGPLLADFIRCREVAFNEQQGKQP